MAKREEDNLCRIEFLNTANSEAYCILKGWKDKVITQINLCIKM